MKALGISLTWLALLAAFPAAADTRCDEATSTIEINQCAQRGLEQADKQLNAAYQAALKRTDSALSDPQQRKETRQLLVEAQRLWIKFRDKDCEAVYSRWRDGTIRGVMHIGCMTEHTQQRTKTLESFSDVY